MEKMKVRDLNDDIIGILTFSDLFSKASKVMKECGGKAMPQ